ncbi:SdpI family protein [Natronorubrum sp. DTA7]|uniref:SdpI family protein n=1 Tax=Natronorubrum sp. DTA7 TaxID=3447016 RepID=UPI003F825847
MKPAHRLAIAGGIAVLAALLSSFVGDSVPEQLVTNWDAAGEPSGTMPKEQALWLPPALMAVLIGLFAVLPRIDPLRENIATFRRYYDWFVVVLTAFLFLVHAGILAFNLGYEFHFVHLLLAGVALLFYYTGVILTKSKRNWFIGIRTPWTLSSDEVWDRTNKLGGRLFKFTAILALVGLLFGEWAIYFLLVPALLTAVVTVVYSYYLYERVEREVDAEGT